MYFVTALLAEIRRIRRRFPEPGPASLYPTGWPLTGAPCDDMISVAGRLIAGDRWTSDLTAEGASRQRPRALERRRYSGRRAAVEASQHLGAGGDECRTYYIR